MVSTVASGRRFAPKFMVDPAQTPDPTNRVTVLTVSKIDAEVQTAPLVAARWALTITRIGGISPAFK